MKSEDEILTVDELAKYLKVNKSTVYKLISSGEISAVKVGRAWRFKKSEIDNWFEEKKIRGNLGSFEGPLILEI